MQLKSIIIIALVFIKSSCTAQSKKTEIDNTNKFYTIIEQANEPTVFATYLIMDTRNAISERFIKKEEVGKLYPDKIKKKNIVNKIKKRNYTYIDERNL